MNILGISCFYHDSAAALVRDGNVIAAAQEERFTRKKHDESFPVRAVEFCLKQGGITIEDVDYVVFYDKPFLKLERLLETYLAFVPLGVKSFMVAIPSWLKDKLWVGSSIRKKLGYHGKILFTEHHESHAASAFFPSPFKEAAFLTLDGVGEWATASFGHGRGNAIRIESEIHFPHSLGLLYSAFTYYTGFKVNSGEYKVMGLAPYGEPRYKHLIYEHLIDVKSDGSFRINMDYLNYAQGLTMTSRKFDELFGGPPRRPESKLTQKEMDLARSLQEVTEEVVMKIARHVYDVTGQKYLCLAGGVALNCVANGKLMREGPFKRIWIQPAAGDAGGALGAALYVWYDYLENPRVADDSTDALHGSLLGPAFSAAEIQDYLDIRAIPYTRYDDGELFSNVAGLIARGKVVGWFQGRMEFGPRALGARSILADARSDKMQSKLNLKIKFRESFRPFAPAVLAEDASQYFELDRQSPYMLLTAYVNKQRRRSMTPSENGLWGIARINSARSDIPAVTHIDYSARVQTVDSENNPRFYELIKSFRSQTGCSVVVNTSFNVRGEPIVCTPADAYCCFMRTGMDYLVMGNFVLSKSAQPEFNETEDWHSKYGLD